MELALLSAVPGLDGGPLTEPGVKLGAPTETDRGSEWGLLDGGTDREGRAGEIDRGESAGILGAGLNMGMLEAIGGPTGGEGWPPLADRLGGADPLGGGGVDTAAGLALLGSFLLTHLLSSLS